MRVLVIGDTHCPAMHPGYIRFLKGIEKKYKCNHVVHIGDMVDWHAISFHEKDPSMPSAKDEYRKARRQVRKIHEAFPVVDYLIGNHSDLPNRKARSVGLFDEQIVPFKEFWELEGWTVHPRYSKIYFDKVQYRHGDMGKGGQINAAYNNVGPEQCSIVQGDKHSQGGVVYTAGDRHRSFGLQVGTGVKPGHQAMNYGKKYSSRPIVGCGVVIDGVTGIFEPMKL